MKIAKIEDVDLSKYRIAFARSNIKDDYDRSQNEVNKIYEIEPELNWAAKTVMIALIPREKRLVDCGGHDWHKHNARDNAGDITEYPKGTIFLKGVLGQQLLVSTEP